MTDQPANNIIPLGQLPLPERPVLLPLRQPRTQAEAQELQSVLDALHVAAKADNHVVVSPTHVMVRGGQVVGYLSIGALPTVHCWFDSKHKHVLDSIKMIEHGETVGRERGLTSYAVACCEQSPFYAHMERLGYRKLGVTTLWVKDL